MTLLELENMLIDRLETAYRATEEYKELIGVAISAAYHQGRADGAKEQFASATPIGVSQSSGVELRDL